MCRERGAALVTGRGRCAAATMDATRRVARGLGAALVGVVGIQLSKSCSAVGFWPSAFSGRQQIVCCQGCCSRGMVEIVGRCAVRDESREYKVWRFLLKKQDVTGLQCRVTQRFVSFIFVGAALVGRGSLCCRDGQCRVVACAGEK